MAYFSLIQFLNTLDNPVEGLGQNDSVFLSRFVMFGGFVDNEIGIADCANHCGSGGVGGGGGGGGGGGNGGRGDGGGRGSGSSALAIL